MTAEKKYLIHLISCFLNGKQPENRTVDWNEVFRLADINDIGAVVSHEIKMLSPDYQPQGELKSKFNQLIGRAVQAYEKKEIADGVLFSLLKENAIDYVLVKGAVVKKLYPVKEFRTSGDTDVIIKSEDFEKAVSVFTDYDKNNQFGITEAHIKDEALLLRINGSLVEVHNGADVKNAYFDNIFSVAQKGDGFEYALSPYYSLMYVFLHFVKHIVDRGAGIRMLMDMDVLIRSIENFDTQIFFEMCDDAGELSYAKLTAYVLKKAFDTPIDSAESYENVYDGFIDAVFDGGSFGYLVQSTGFYHYYKNVDSTKKVNSFTKFKAALRYVFPPAEYVRSYRDYSQKHPVLTPVAYVARAKDAFFKRRGKALGTFEQIFSITDEDIKQRSFLEEIDDKNRSEL